MASEPRTVGPGRGADWWGEAWRLFTPAAGVWVLIALVLIVVNFAALFVPIVGAVATAVLYPVFFGGLMLGCRALDRGNPITLAHLFAGFTQRAGPLVIVGLIYAALELVIGLIVVGMMIAIFGVSIYYMLIGQISPAQTGVALENVVLAVLLGFLFFLLLLLPLVMAIWFAPALIMLGGLTPAAALIASFNGCLRNIVPFLVYGLIAIVLAILASIPFGLGWLVLLPVTIASVYASYCDIFEDRGTA